MRKRSAALDQRIRENTHRANLAMALARIRRVANLTQQAVAKAIGKDQAFVSRMESVTGPEPTADSIDAYVHACGGEVAYLLGTPRDIAKLSDRAVPHEVRDCLRQVIIGLN